MPRHPQAPGLPRAQNAVSRVVATAVAEQGVEWDLTRSELLDAMAADGLE